jgi:hypothetical protein
MGKVTGRQAVYKANKTTSSGARLDRTVTNWSCCQDWAHALKQKGTSRYCQVNAIQPPAKRSKMSGVTELEPPATDLITLTRHILSQQYALGPQATGDLTMLLIAIQVSWGVSWSDHNDDDDFRCPCFPSSSASSSPLTAGLESVHPTASPSLPHPTRTVETMLTPQVTSKYIASNVRKARLINLVGLAGDTNVQGEDQKKLDVLSNDIMVNALRASGKCKVMVSEEVEDAIVVKGGSGK